MAVTQIHAIQTTLIKAIDYIIDPDKTNDTLLVYGYNCTPEIAAFEFDVTKKAANKQGGILAHHLIQSFAPDEVDYETAHEIGKQLADTFLKGKYEYVISTHIDCNHIHNHIIFNSVPIDGGNKFRETIPNYFRIRDISDKLCLENGLSVIAEPSKGKAKTCGEHYAEKDGVSWKAALRESIDRSIIKARDFEDFLALMKAEDYEIKQGKHIAFRAKGQERFTRAKRLGERYTEKNIRALLSCKGLPSGITERIKTAATKKKTAAAPVMNTAPKAERTGISLLIDIENNVKAKQSAGYSHRAKVNNLKMAAMTINYLSDNKLLDYDTLTARHDEIKNKHKSTLARIKEVEKRIKQLDGQISDLDSYRKTKPVVDKLESVMFKDKYKREHETDFILFNAAKQAVKAHFPSGKYPLIKDLRAEIKELYEEKNKLYPEYYEAKDELKNISTIKKNVDRILEKPPEKERDKEKEREAHIKDNDIHYF